MQIFVTYIIANQLPDCQFK